MSKQLYDISVFLQLKRLFPIAKKYQLYKIKLEKLAETKEVLEKNLGIEKFRLEYCTSEASKLNEETFSKKLKKAFRIHERQLESYKLSIIIHESEINNIKAELDKLYDIMYEYNCYCQDNFRNYREYNDLFLKYESTLRSDEIYSATSLYEYRKKFIQSEEEFNLLEITLSEYKKLDSFLSKTKSYIEQFENGSSFSNWSDEDKEKILSEKIDETFSRAIMLADALNQKKLCEAIILKKPEVFLHKDKSLNWLYNDSLIQGKVSHGGASSTQSYIDGYRIKVKRAIESLLSEFDRAEYNRKKAEFEFIGEALDYLLSKRQ